MIRLIVCDIDDTLLGSHEMYVCKENVQAVHEARERGIHVTLATGRMYPTASGPVEELSICEPVIAANGSDIRVNGIPVDQTVLDDDLVAEAFRTATKHDMLRYLFCGDETLYLAEDENRELFLKWAHGSEGLVSVRMLDTEEELLQQARGRTNKILLWVKTEDAFAAAFSELRALSDRLNVVSGEVMNVEITGEGATKAAGLEKVCRMLGIDRQDVMAIGDSGNDADMLRWAGVGVAVGNAMPEAKKAADYVVAECTEGGVAEAIRKYALGQRD